MVLFYFTKFIYPLPLAHNYYWVYKTITFQHVILPLIVDLVIAAGITYLAVVLRKKSPRQHFPLFMFFAIWLLLGVLLHMQIIPLDVTVSETWFYFSMAGLLGLIGVLLNAFMPRVSKGWPIAVVVIVICLLGFRTWERGFDWKDVYSLAYRDIAVSKDDYVSLSNIAYGLDSQGEYSQAKPYVLRAVNIYPSFNNYNTLGITLAGLHDYPGARDAYLKALGYNYYENILCNLGQILTVYGDYDANKRILAVGLRTYPRNSLLWSDLAILEYSNGYTSNANLAVAKAVQYGNPYPEIYKKILGNQPLDLNIDPKPSRGF